MISVVGWTGVRSSPSTSGFSCSTIAMVQGVGCRVSGVGKGSTLCRSPDPTPRTRDLLTFHHMTAELVPQRGGDLRRERLLLTRCEPGQERERDDRRRHVVVDRVGDGPAALARVLHVAADLREVAAALGEGALRELEQPGADHRALAPEV